MGGELLRPPTSGLEVYGFLRTRGIDPSLHQHWGHPSRFPRTRGDEPAASVLGGSRLMTGGGYGAMWPGGAVVCRRLRV